MQIFIEFLLKITGEGHRDTMLKLHYWKYSCICFIYSYGSLLTHWGQMTHIWVSNLTIIGSENGLSPCQRQAIIWTYDGILLIGPLGTNFSEILIEIHKFSFRFHHVSNNFAWALFQYLKSPKTFQSLSGNCLNQWGLRFSQAPAIYLN